MKATVFKHGINYGEQVIKSWDWGLGSLLKFFLFYPFFFPSFPILHFSIENMCHSFLKSFQVRILKLSILVATSCCIVALRMGLIVLIVSLFVHFVCLFRENLCHNFPWNYMYKLQSTNMVYMYGEWVIVLWDLHLGSLLFFFHFSSIFLSVPMLHFSIANLCHSFFKNYSS